MRMILSGVLRGLWSRRGFVAILTTLEAVGVAGLFIGALLIDAVLVRPVPFPRGKDIVHIWHQQPQRGWSTIFLNRAETDFYRERTTSLESLVTFTLADVVITERERSTSTRAVTLVGDICELLGVTPVAGRCLTAADSAPGAAPVAVIRAAQAVAHDQDAGRSLGREVRINDQLYEIVGVVPDSLTLRHFSSHLYGPVDYMIPLPSPAIARTATERRLMLMGRLRRGTSFTTAAAEMDILSRAYATEVPAANDGQVAQLRTLFEETVVFARPQATAIAAGATLLALLVIFNSILLRAAELTRRRALLVLKTAIGASYRRLLAEEVASSVGALAITGMLAWAISNALLESFIQMEPWGVPGLRQDAGVAHFLVALMFVGGASALGGVLLVRRVLRSGGSAGTLPSRTVGATRADARATRAMVMVQCAMAAVLLGCTLLLFKTMWNLGNVDLGLHQNLLTIQTTLPRALADSSQQREQALDRVLDRGTLPSSVEAVSVINDLPLARRGRFRSVEVAGGRTGVPTMADYRVVAANYAEVAGVRLVAGRFIEGRQQAAAAEYAVNEAFVRRYLNGRTPVGTSVRIPRAGGVASDGVETEGVIVGVVADVRHWGPDRPSPAEIYVAYQLDPPTRFAIIFRPRGTSDQAGAQMQERLRGIAPELAAFPVRSIPALLRDSLDAHRFAAALFAVFAIAAISVTALGLYGLAAGYVTARRAEIAVRLSIGASRRDVVTLIARQALLPAILGCIAGTMALTGAGRLLQSWLYEVRATDPGLLTVLPVSMTTVALLALIAPLWSALRIEAVELLRSR